MLSAPSLPLASGLALPGAISTSADQPPTTNNQPPTTSHQPPHRSSAHGRLHYSTIKVQVFRRGLLPAEVTRHRLAHHIAPAFGLLVLIDRTHRGPHEIGGFVVVEEKARDVILDRIGETADAAG